MVLDQSPGHPFSSLCRVGVALGCGDDRAFHQDVPGAGKRIPNNDDDDESGTLVDTFGQQDAGFQLVEDATTVATAMQSLSLLPPDVALHAGRVSSHG